MFTPFRSYLTHCIHTFYSPPLAIIWLACGSPTAAGLIYLFFNGKPLCSTYKGRKRTHCTAFHSVLSAPSVVSTRRWLARTTSANHYVRSSLHLLQPFSLRLLRAVLPLTHHPQKKKKTAPAYTPSALRLEHYDKM
jgi:hypothetical protein